MTIKNQLSSIRKIIDQHLAKADAEIREKLDINSFIELGRITYDTDESGELSQFKAQTIFKIKGKEKEVTHFKNLVKYLKKYKLISSTTHFNSTFTSKRGEKVKFVGLNLNARKNPIMLEVDGKTEYKGGIGYLISEGGLNTEENRALVKKDTKFSQYKKALDESPFNETKREHPLVEYVYYILWSKHRMDIHNPL